MHDGVNLANIGKKFVAQPLSLTSPLDQTSDINKLHARWNQLLALA
ncbi:MAG: Uncharacterised protein [Prochlorococcus marinus str. MIT 9313]|nr:MAG: Uncharacterised protein [Prochlorococcus marinus str. MIT 9313]